MKKVGNFKIETENLDDYKQECFIKIKKDKEVYGILLNNGFSDETIKEYIASCNQFYNDFKEWNKIKTYEDVIKNGIYYSYKLVFNNGNIERQQEILEPYKELLNYESKFLVKDFDITLKDLKFSDVDNKSLKTKLKDELSNGNWIYIYGAPRSGKSYCAIALINGYARKGKDNLAFIDCESYISKLSEYYFKYKNDFNEEMTKLKDANVLVLDGFGNEYVNDIIRDNIILPLLSDRARNKKMTIFTSNLTLNDVTVLYSGKNGNNVKGKQLKMILESMIKKELLSSNSNLY